MAGVDSRRINALNIAAQADGPVVYWMSREQRVQDNWGLLYARELAGKDVPLVVVFCLVPSFPGATLRHYDFMLRGLQQVEQDLTELGISFAFLSGDPEELISQFVGEIRAGAVVTDFDPLRIKQQWQAAVAGKLAVPLIEVDSHNVVPARFVTEKCEYSARTIRPKIHRLLPEFLEEFPQLRAPVVAGGDFPAVDWVAARASINVDESIGPVDLDSGEPAAREALDDFIARRLPQYAEQRNDPNAEATSRLSAYFHFGQLAPQRAALAAASAPFSPGAEAFIEELVVRRELAENFCLHTPQYDALDSAPQWALKTLEEHAENPRDYIYSLADFEHARTHSELWNAAQKQLLKSGYMHGYMRMYWAKKILEWSVSPEEALQIVITLNDRYQMDGRDPNGYVGALWSIGGLHDRGWKKRPVFGSIRYMNERGCRRKFDVDGYIERWG